MKTPVIRLPLPWLAATSRGGAPTGLRKVAVGLSGGVDSAVSAYLLKQHGFDPSSTLTSSRGLRPRSRRARLRGKCIALGLSGGVDSAVSAYLLKSYGYDVHCVYLNCYDGDAPGCRGDQDRKDALAVALHLGLPFQVLDFRKEYQKAVIDYFKKEYLAGRTPNPDVVCNREIKFGLFLDWSIKEGFDAIATGHYAKLLCVMGYELWVEDGGGDEFIRNGASSRLTPNSQLTTHNSQPILAQPKDLHKDQTYFLWAVQREKFKHVLFPLGNLLKSEVREIAKKIKLPVAEKKDSTGICFVGEVRVEDFLKRLGVKEKEGEVVIRKVPQVSQVAQVPQARKLHETRDTSDFVVIGRHRGVWFYTIGQRHGFSVNRWFPKSKEEGKRQKVKGNTGIGGLLPSSFFLLPSIDCPPLYVIAKDVKHNRLIVGFGPETYRDNFEVSDCNWLAPEKVGPFLERSDLYTTDCLVRIRHLGDLIPCSVIGFPFSVVGNKSAGFQSAGSEQNNRKLTNQELKTENRELITVFLATPARGIAPGQSAVFYSEEGIVLGGGVIQ